MSEEEVNKLIIKNQELDGNNRNLVKKLNEKDFQFKELSKLYQKEKSKLFKIYEVVCSNKINENNYLKMLDWIKKIIKEEV